MEGVPLFVTHAERSDDYIAALLPGEAHISDALTLRTADGAITVTRACFPEPQGSEQACNETSGDGTEADGDDVVQASNAADVVAGLLKRRGAP